MSNISAYISEKIEEKVISVRPVSGGDISSAYRVVTGNGRYFLKVNNASFAREMFEAEKVGLEAIQATNTIAVPQVFLVDTLGEDAFLLMEFVESKRPNASDYRRLGHQLAKMHLCDHPDFGFPSDNFIGSLRQQNRSHVTWPEFYWHQRILPQLKMALSKSLLPLNLIPDEDKALILLQNLFGNVHPSLLHGDLWGGNYLISTDGTPFLIDPAVYYGHSMVDIAMSRLFGGFSADFYDAYHQLVPQPAHYVELIDLYQLYYLLVHLNLFGSGYYSSVSSILKKYF